MREPAVSGVVESYHQARYSPLLLHRGGGAVHRDAAPVPGAERLARKFPDRARAQGFHNGAAFRGVRGAVEPGAMENRMGAFPQDVLRRVAQDLPGRLVHEDYRAVGVRQADTFGRRLQQRLFLFPAVFFEPVQHDFPRGAGRQRTAAPGR